MTEGFVRCAELRALELEHRLAKKKFDVEWEEKAAKLLPEAALTRA